ncbi:hypothetical protein AAHE18_03G142100 [Arachis hypogaea]|nr:Pyruvate kinase 1, cytosolic [Arachis hypogaea]
MLKEAAQVVHEKFETESLTHFYQNLQEADGIILFCGNLGIDLPSEKMIFCRMKVMFGLPLFCVLLIIHWKIQELLEASWDTFGLRCTVDFLGLFYTSGSSLQL